MNDSVLKCEVCVCTMYTYGRCITSYVMSLLSEILQGNLSIFKLFSQLFTTRSVGTFYLLVSQQNAHILIFFFSNIFVVIFDYCVISFSTHK